MINIVLYKPEMPANVGNIMRTAFATNSHLHLIGPLLFSLDDKSLKRAGLDYMKSTDFTVYESLDSFFKTHNDKLVVFITRYSKQNYTSFDYGRHDQDVYLMFGNESHGLPRDLLTKYKVNTVRIPMTPSARSLNLSNAVAIVTYEVLRQQDFYNLATSEVIKGDDFL